MNKNDLNSWEDFIPRIQEIQNQYRGNKILYRGGDADKDNKHLKTTLERFSKKSWTVKSYIKLIMRFTPQIESYTLRAWDLPKWEELERKLANNYSENALGLLPQFYSYWIHLRQHGFPSPLLDWTASPYIAAFFAFSKYKEIERNAIFVYVEYPNMAKTYHPDSGVITKFGPNINTHKRHFLQQAWYTVAARNLPDQKDWEFISHAGLFQEYIEGEEDGFQDIMIKITIPTKERIKVLSYLDEYNLNQFSLFQTEEDLIKTIAFREIEKAE